MKLPVLAGSLLLVSCAAAPTTQPSSAFSGPAPESTPPPAVSQPAQDDPIDFGNEVNENRLSVYLGQRTLTDDGFWGSLEEQPVFGIEYAHEGENSSVGWVIGLSGAAEEKRIGGTDVEAETGEIYGGIVKSFPSGTGLWRPYIGGGVSYLTTELESGGGSVDDSSIAGYLHGGLAVHLTKSFFLGIDARMVFGSDISLVGLTDNDVDYEQLTGFLGWGF